MSIHVHRHCQNIAQNKVIWYKMEILSILTKIHILNYIFHISSEPNELKYMRRAYTLQHVDGCPPVL